MAGNHQPRKSARWKLTLRKTDGWKPSAPEERQRAAVGIVVVGANNSFLRAFFLYNDTSNVCLEDRMKIGDVLKQARLEKGLTLNQVAREIFVQEKYLRALEDGEYELIPGEAYQRAYFRTYAEYLGLTQYIEDLTTPRKFSQNPEDDNVQDIIGGTWDGARIGRVAVKIAIILLIPILIIVGVARAKSSKQMTHPPSNRVQSTQPTGSLQVVPLEGGPTWQVPEGGNAGGSSGGNTTGTSGGDESQNDPASVLTEGQHELKITTTAASWVDINTRDGNLVKRVLVAGESLTFHDLIGFSVSVGKPESCELIFDGQPVTWEVGQTAIVLPPGAIIESSGGAGNNAPNN
jgi:cytoskeletal protein RodZ